MTARIGGEEKLAALLEGYPANETGKISELQTDRSIAKWLTSSKEQLSSIENIIDTELAEIKQS